MKYTLQSTGLVLFLVLFQYSFFDVWFSHFSLPVLLISLMVVLVPLGGYDRALLALFESGVFYILLGGSKFFLIEGFILASLVAVFIQRVRLSHPSDTLLFLLMTSLTLSGGMLIVVRFITHQSIISITILENLGFILLVLPMIFFFTRAWYQRIDRLEQNEFRGLRTS